MSVNNKRRLVVHGQVAPGYEPVRNLFTQNVTTLEEDNAQLCIYVRGKCVVDLWATNSAEGAFNADSLVNIFSSGKTLEAIAVAWLVDRGLLSYDDKIALHWPEFGAEGKHDLTVADLMRHEAGLANLETSLDLEDLFTENIKQNAVGQILEQHPKIYVAPDKFRREYHAITRGWIVNELFRRVDPAQRTIGEFLRDEISDPLKLDLRIGVPEHEMERVVPVRPLGFLFQFVQSLKPRFLGRKVVHNFWTLMKRFLAMLPAIREMRSQGERPPPLKGLKDLHFFNEPAWTRGETPSANATCSARGLARLAAIMAAGGSLDDTQLLGSEAWEAMHAESLEAEMGGLMKTRFTQGGIDCFLECGPQSSVAERDFNEGREGFFGWMGLGGSIFQWNPEQEIGFAFVPTTLHVLDFMNERGKVYQAEVMRCARILGAARLSEESAESATA